ncbi:hypothetical protein HDU83_001367 [Entophlyctis luteolus]|nr:hypothetical protein HDU83_001367 [Entophlyctis luteolus]
MDIFGNNHSSVNSEKLKCVKCGILFPTIRYAQHLEKCLGLGGRRAAVRNVNRRMATNQSSSSSPNLNESEDDYPLRDKSTWILLLIYYLLNLTIVQKNNSPLPAAAPLSKITKMADIDFASSTQTSTPLINCAYSSPNEISPTAALSLIPNEPLVAKASGLHSPFGGKTRPGLIPKPAGKVPANGYGKVPRIVTSAMAMMVGGSGSGMEDSEYAESEEEWKGEHHNFV